jgi:hypothetical protein
MFTNTYKGRPQVNACYWEPLQNRQNGTNNINIFHCKTFLNVAKFGFLVWKYTICSLPMKMAWLLAKAFQQFCNAWAMHAFTTSFTYMEVISDLATRFHQFTRFLKSLKCQWRFHSGANPSIASYNASVVKIYSATNSVARFRNKKCYNPLHTTLAL